MVEDRTRKRLGLSVTNTIKTVPDHIPAALWSSAWGQSQAGCDPTRRAALVEVLQLFDAHPSPDDPYCGPHGVPPVPPRAAWVENEQALPPLNSEQDQMLQRMLAHTSNMFLTGPAGRGKVRSCRSADG